MTQPRRILWFAVFAFGILFFPAAAFAQQSQSWKFPVSISTTASGYPSPVVASTGPLAVGTYSITAKTSLQNLFSAREPSGKCFLVVLDANGNVIPGAELDETDVTLDQTSNGADTASITLSTVFVVTAGGPNNIGLHCRASQKSQFTNTVITATSLQGPPGPQGQAGLPGAPGAAATIQVGQVTVGSSGQAAVSNVGTSNAAVLNFTIPQGPKGDTGAAGAAGVAGAPGAQGPPGVDNRGAWSIATAYNASDAVFDAGSYWLATAANTNSEPSPTNTNWQLMAAGFHNRGSWMSTVTYNANDAVTDGGSFWLALVTNTNSEPSPTNFLWQQLAAQGAAGAPGAAGLAGQSVMSFAEPSGANCAFGGSKFVAANGTTYSCNGVSGAQGSSVTAVALPAGSANCPFGGTQFTSASGTTYACNGAPAGAQFFTISGTLSGLASTTSVVLLDNGTGALTLNANGTFTFATPLVTGSTYAVTVGTQPTNGTCAVTNGTGTVGTSNVTNVAVDCVVPTVLTTLASGQDHPSAIAVDGNNVYWADSPPTLGGGPGIMSVPLAGGTVSPLFLSTNPGAIAIDLSNLYFAGNNALNRIPKGGGTPPTLVANSLSPGSPFAPFPPFFGLAIDAQNAYVSNTSNIVKAILAGNPGSVFVSVPSGSQPYAIALDNANVYWTETSGVFGSGTGGVGRVMKAPKVGGTPIVMAQGQNFPADLAVDANNLYWTNNGDGTVMMVPLGGGTPTVIASGQSFPFGIAVDQTNVYWTNNGTSSGGTVMKAPISGGVATIIASGQNFPMAIAVDQTSVYWTNNGGPNAPTGAAATGTVMKANK